MFVLLSLDTDAKIPCVLQSEERKHVGTMEQYCVQKIITTTVCLQMCVYYC